MFRERVTFDDVLDLYVFDRTMRLHVMDALERVEVAVRAALTDHMSTMFNDPHWYVNPSHFKNATRHADFLQMVGKTCEDRLGSTPEIVASSPAAEGGSAIHRSALEHYLTTYGGPSLPPSWLMVETLTLGQLEKLAGNLVRRSDKSAIARSIGLTAPVLESWLRTYVRVRNICAHHGRLWNVGLGVYPMIPTAANISWLRSPDALPNGSKWGCPLTVDRGSSGLCRLTV